MSAAGQRALARLFGLTDDPDAPPADPAPTGHQWVGGVPFAVSQTPPPADETPPDFDGGTRETAPAPDEPDRDHDELLLNLIRQAGGGGF